MINKKSIFFLIFLFLLGFKNSLAQGDELEKLKIEMTELKTLPQSRLIEILNAFDRFIRQYRNVDNRKAAEICLWSSDVEEELLNRQGDLITDAVITRLTDGLNLDPNNPNLYRRLASAFKKQGHIDRAKGCLRKAIELNRVDLKAIKNLIDIFKEEKQPDSTIILYRLYLSQVSKDEDTWIELIDTQLLIKDIDGAIQSSHEAITQNTRCTNLRLKLADIYEKEGELDKAIVQYDSILIYVRDGTIKKQVYGFLENVRKTLEDKRKIEIFIQRGEHYSQFSDTLNLERSYSYFDSVLIFDRGNSFAFRKIKEIKQRLCDEYYRLGLVEENRKYWNNAFLCFTKSLCNAESKENKRRAFIKQRIVAENGGISFKARNEEEAANQALKDLRYTEALERYITARQLDKSRKTKLEPREQEAQSKNYFQDGMNALSKKNYAFAITYFSKVKEIDPTYDKIDWHYNQADSLLNWSILSTKLKEYYQAEKLKNDWHSAYGLIKLLSNLDPYNDNFNTELMVAELQIKEKNDIPLYIYLFFLLLSIVLLFILISFFEKIRELNERKKEKNELSENTIAKLTKKAAIIRMLGVMFLFGIIVSISIYLCVEFISGTNLLERLIGGTVIFIAAFYISLIFAKFYLTKEHLTQLGRLGNLVNNLKPRVN